MLISVIMPNYNTPYDFLMQSVESVLNQSMSDFELIIVDDNSTSFNDTLFWESLLKKDSRIRVISNTHKKGVAGALNTGIELA